MAIRLRVDPVARLWPTSLSARIIGLTLLALVISQLVGYFSFVHGRDRFVEHMVSDYMSQAVLSINRSLSFVAPARQAQVVHALSNRFATYRLHDRQGRCGRSVLSSAHYSEEFAERLGVPRDRVQVCVGRDVMHVDHGASVLGIALSYRRDDGRWLQVSQRLPDGFGRWAHGALGNIFISALIMIVAVFFASRLITRPLRDLANAAERFGRGESVKKVPERGGDEIRRSIVEFNHMRERLERFVAERTRLVAALAHDLRTPITALRLRLEFLADDDNTRAMNTTLADMAHMTEAALTFMREDAATEATRKIDLAALIDALCEDYRAARAAVVFEPQAPVTLICRPVAIRRALRNIIDNALAYGQSATLRLSEAGDGVAIDIEDDGPGIEPAQMESVFDAFVRLETSRSRDTGGAGLGLSIARSAVRGHGGDITLANRPEGGLRVHIHLPRPRL